MVFVFTRRNSSEQYGRGDGCIIHRSFSGQALKMRVYDWIAGVTQRLDIAAAVKMKNGA